MMLSQLLSAVHLILESSTTPTNLPQEIYLPSLQVERHNVYFIYRTPAEKFLVVYEDRLKIQDFQLEEVLGEGNQALGLAKLSAANQKVLATRFPWILPVSRQGYKYSFGLGDRLGNAGNAHLQLFKGRGVLPVLAQQSIRELTLTGRTFTEVLLDASWSVFEEGYQDGWGADGDHVKHPYEVDYAVQTGYTMITLDASEVIHNEIAELSDEELAARFNQLTPELKEYFVNTYVGQTFDLGHGVSVSVTEKDLQQSVLIFFDAVQFAKKIYDEFVVPYNLDFELSMDETIVPTTPANHYFVANELHRLGVTPETLAPKFYGEFQKAIDYIGELPRFEKEYAVHEAIAEHFNYRLSIHSGSDKLSVYPVIGEVSKAHGWHVKTAGTNWLEALKVIAVKDPGLLWEIYRYSYENIADVKSFYEFKATQETAVKPADVNVADVFDLLLADDSRQILHTMFGSILNVKENYQYVFRDKFFAILYANQDLYDHLLHLHIAKHLDLLQGLAKDKAEVLAKYAFDPKKA